MMMSLLIVRNQVMIAMMMKAKKTNKVRKRAKIIKIIKMIKTKKMNPQRVPTKAMKS